MSVSSAQNLANPPPVPEVATVTLTSGASSRKMSAAASVSGATVDEPSATTEPLALAPSVESVPPVGWPPHAVRRRPATAMAAVSPAILRER